MESKIYIPYIPIHAALYSDKHDELGYIWGDKRRGDGLKTEEWVKNLGSEFNATNSRNVDYFLSGGNIGYLNKKYGILEYKDKQIDNTKFEFYEIGCPILNQRKNVMQPLELVKCRMENLMFVIIVDIPIKNLEPDVESEIRFWVRDSMQINVHHEIPEGQRLEMLPTKDLKVRLGDVQGVLSKCRVINFEKPYRLTLLVEKIK